MPGFFFLASVTYEFADIFGNSSALWLKIIAAPMDMNMALAAHEYIKTLFKRSRGLLIEGYEADIAIRLENFFERRRLSVCFVLMRSHFIKDECSIYFSVIYSVKW